MQSNDGIKPFVRILEHPVPKFLTAWSVHILIVVALIVPAGPVGAIIIRHDRPDSRYLNLGAKFPEVGHVMRQVGCTLIDPRWAIGAAHSVEDLSPFSDRYVVFAEKRYQIEKIIIPSARVPFTIDSSADIALIKLAEPVTGIAPALLYDKNDEEGKIIRLVGRGRSGTALSATVDDGKVRAGTERIDAVFQDSLASIFHEPPMGTDLEAASGAGDSGDPAIWEDAGHRYIIGVGSFTGGENAKTPMKYQTLQGFARISTWRKWILDTMSADPPSTVPMWTPMRSLNDGSGFPASRSGQIAQAFLNAYNSGQLSALATFYGDNAVQRPGRSNEERAHQWDSTRQEWGTLEVRGITESGPYKIAVASYSPTAARWLGILFELTDTKPYRVDQLIVGEISKPSL